MERDYRCSRCDWFSDVPPDVGRPVDHQRCPTCGSALKVTLAREHNESPED